MCPTCKSSLEWLPEGASCRDCGRVYPVRGGRIYFVEQPERGDELDSVKGRLKKALGRFYYSIGVNVFAPHYPIRLGHWISRYSDREKLIVDAGCGNRRIDGRFIGLDMMDYDAVDVVCDLTALPFRDDCIDLVFSNSVLEHLPMPFEVAGEFQRCTVPGGINLHIAPFLYPFHASPDDFYRYTHRGMEALFGRCEVVECVNVAGPATLAFAILAEFLSILLSLGNARARAFIYLMSCLVLFPIKYLDVFFVRRKTFRALAPLLLTALRKRD